MCLDEICSGLEHDLPFDVLRNDMTAFFQYQLLFVGTADGVVDGVQVVKGDQPIRLRMDQQGGSSYLR